MFFSLQVKSNDDDFGWGVVLNFQKKANQKVNLALHLYFLILTFLDACYLFCYNYVNSGLQQPSSDFFCWGGISMFPCIVFKFCYWQQTQRKWNRNQSWNQKNLLTLVSMRQNSMFRNSKWQKAVMFSVLNLR